MFNLYNSIKNIEKFISGIIFILVPLKSSISKESFSLKELLKTFSINYVFV